MKFQIGKIALVIFLLIFILLIIIDYFNHTYIKAEFTKTDPMPSRMGVYYKGYRLGTTSKLKISKDFKTTYLYITLNQRGLHLPKNISVTVKNYDEDTKYVDIIYPPAPTIKYIKTGDVIKGNSHLSIGLDGISNANQAHLDNLSEKGETLLNSDNKTANALTELFSLITDILYENRENLYESSENLKNSTANMQITTKNLKELSEKINDEITRQTIRNSAENLEITTTNLAGSSKNFSSISNNFTKTSSDFSVLIPELRNLIDIGKTVLCNLNKIILGLGKTLSKRFGGMRVMFGIPIKE